MIWKVWQGTECMIPLSGHFHLFWKQLGRYELDWAVYREQTAQGDRTSPNLLQPTRSGWAGQCWLFIQGLRPRDSLLLLPLCLLTWKNWGRCICWLDLLPPLFCSLPVPCLASFFFWCTTSISHCPRNSSIWKNKAMASGVQLTPVGHTLWTEMQKPCLPGTWEPGGTATEVNLQERARWDGGNHLQKSLRTSNGEFLLI